MDKDPVSERIKVLFERFGNGNVSAFARSISVNHQTVRDLIKGEKGGPSWPVLQNILKAYPAIRLEWLMQGRGEMMKPAPDGGTGIKNSAVSVPPELARTEKQTFHGGMVVRDYAIRGAGRRTQPDTPTQPATNTPPIGTDLVQLLAEHDTKLAKHEEILAELQQLVAQLQQAPKD